jgi:hypothetical protein
MIKTRHYRSAKAMTVVFLLHVIAVRQHVEWNKYANRLE